MVGAGFSWLECSIAVFQGPSAYFRKGSFVGEHDRVTRLPLPDHISARPKDLLRETAFLRSYDSFRQQAGELVDVPERTLDLLFRFLSQNDGKLSNNKSSANRHQSRRRFLKKE